MKKNISKIRSNITDQLWALADNKVEVFEEKNFTEEAIKLLKDFEKSLLKAMTKDGWDGEEDADKIQWTITGALFYSIIVITTIGTLLFRSNSLLIYKIQYSKVTHQKNSKLISLRNIF